MQRFLICFALSLCYVRGHIAEDSHTAFVGVNFFQRFKHEMFFNSTMPETDHGLRYVVSTLGRPDLPDWLQVVHGKATEPAFVFGTPSTVDDTTTIKVTAIERGTNTISQRTHNITVNQLPDQAHYFVDLTMRNFNVDDLFERDLLNDILVRMHHIWPSSGNTYITKVTSLLEVEERLRVATLPAEQSTQSNGVRIRVGATGDFSNLLRRVETEVEQGCKHAHPQPYISIDHWFQPDFQIDWCKYKLTTSPIMDMATHVETGPGRILLSGYDMSAMTNDIIPRREFSNEFFGTVVFPILLALVIGIVLSIFFFCIRQGTERRDELTPQTQLSQFNTIRRATTNLRLMSQRRDVPSPLTPSSRPREVTNTTTTTTTTTLVRNQPPPPYRLPPSYPTDANPAPVDENITPVRLEDVSVGEDLSLTLVSSSTLQHDSGADNLGHQ